MTAGAVAPNNAPLFRRTARAEGAAAMAARLIPRRQDFGTWLFLLPAVAFFVGYQVYPIIRVLWISFTDYQFLSNEPANWVGFANYAAALHDPLMWKSLWRATLFTLMFLPGTIILPLLLAILIDRVTNLPLERSCLHPPSHTHAGSAPMQRARHG